MVYIMLAALERPGVSRQEPVDGLGRQQLLEVALRQVLGAFRALEMLFL